MYCSKDSGVVEKPQYEPISPSALRFNMIHDKENTNIIDKQLEYNDPTPSIHDLFVLFDKRFFWGKLGMVEVKWSSRMTTCAGLCYYQGKRGLCSIRLSAPLLSLRTRKDLVETLLHEMIHAYLFVTENHRDRNDHGPEFHKHMNRINSQAGTNITVYHTFLDEVAYYQKHIWRCNGPCQNQRPFFGFVRRAMNRAPGPYDTWWEQHKFNCGGTFVKISEPQRACKQKKTITEKDKNLKTVPGVKDIRDYMQKDNAQNLNLSSPLKVSPTTPNVYTIHDLNKNKYFIKEQYNSKRLNNQTYVIEKKIPKTENSDYSNIQNSFINGNSEASQKLGNSLKDKNAAVAQINNCDESGSEIVQETVRKVWANKYLSSDCTENQDEPMTSNSVKYKNIMCPICNKYYSTNKIYEHIDNCLEESNENKPSSESSKICFSENGKKAVNSSEPVQQNIAEPSANGSAMKFVLCPVCNTTLEKDELNDHLEGCLKCSFADEINFDQEEKICDTVPCPCCFQWISECKINDHIDECLTLISLKNMSE